MSYSESRKNITINRSLLLVLLALAFTVGLFIGKGADLLGTIYGGGAGEYFTDEWNEFRFIRSAPRLRHSDSVRIKELKPFRYKVDALIESKRKAGEASSISFYFRDLNNGLRFGIGERERFSSERFLNLPLMIAYFKWAESSPLVLKRKMLYTGGADRQEEEGRKPVKSLEEGRSYTIDDLVFRMIAYGDVEAYAVLLDNLPPGYLDKIFKDIYADYNPGASDDSLPFSSYASFCRVLFNASYLNKDMSEKALRYLSRSAFKGGIIAGIPSDIESARTFGERTLLITTDGGEKTVKQLHEFGIVYHPNRPYLMGILARGDDPGTLANVIRDISALVYEEVDRQSRD